MIILKEYICCYYELKKSKWSPNEHKAISDSHWSKDGGDGECAVFDQWQTSFRANSM